ncbi:MAG TPA: DUF411 domain-containing protein [Gemmatimonas sp.]|uniref:DUF411 domain-containing protein n=1 Tax=Gemmatimonas sp. TaxID=1962908 RepID=UPI002EDAD0C7
MSAYLPNSDLGLGAKDVAQDRRAFLQRAATLVGILAVGRTALAQPAAQPAAMAMTVYKDPNCGCCSQWVDHVKKAGFTVTVRDSDDMPGVKASFGVPSALHSCHTARVGSYAIEGHVPADLIVKLLKEQPAGRGLAVPGMPVGSPGMEMGSRKDAYDVLLFDKAGKTRVYASR